jgi:hypothetical protein
MYIAWSVNTASITTNINYPIKKMYTDDEFTIIGWSRDSKIAFVNYSENTYYFNAKNELISEEVYSSGVYIYDLIEDHYVDMILSAKGDGTSAHEGIRFEEFWLLYEEKITKMLKKYKIISFPNTEMQKMETLSANYALEWFFQTEKKEYYDEEHGITRERETANFVVRNNRGDQNYCRRAALCYNLSFGIL